MLKKIIIVTAIAGIAVSSLSGCSNGGNILEPDVKITFANENTVPTPKPVVMQPGDIANTPEITIEVGGILTVGRALDPNDYGWSGTSDNEDVVVFVPASTEKEMSIAPHFQALSKGTAKVTSTNSVTGETISTVIIVK